MSSEISRRGLLLGTGGAVAAGLTGLGAFPSFAGPRPSPATDADWAGLAKQLHGRLYRPTDPSFADEYEPFNKRYAGMKPGAVASCADEHDVVSAVRWARSTGTPIVPRAGGHSYGGFSSTLGLLVDVGRMRSVRVREGDALVTAGAGVRNTDVYNALHPYALAFSAGRCPTVGLAGLTLGGGFGFSSRQLGLTADALVSTRMVTATGEVVEADRSQNADLFWACRGGGGGNFGINTSFTYRAHPVGSVATFALRWHTDDGPAVLSALQHVLQEAPRTFSCRAAVSTSGRTAAQAAAAVSVSVLGQFLGSVEDLKALLGPVLTAAKPLEQDIQARTFWDAKEYFFHTTPQNRFAVKSNFANKPLDDDAWRIIVAAVKRWPGSLNPDGAGVALFSFGGAIADLAPTETAFVHRGALWLVAYETSWTEAETADERNKHLAWLGELYQQMQPHVAAEAYQNFVDTDLSTWRQQYYGANWDRLVAVKKAYDPDELFHFKQSIPVTST